MPSNVAKTLLQWSHFEKKHRNVGIIPATWRACKYYLLLYKVGVLLKPGDISDFQSEAHACTLLITCYGLLFIALTSLVLFYVAYSVTGTTVSLEISTSKEWVVLRLSDRMCLRKWLLVWLNRFGNVEKWCWCHQHINCNKEVLCFLIVYLKLSLLL